MIKIDFNKVLNTFKSNRYVQILDNKNNGEQWLNDGAAFYNIGNTEFDAINIKPVLPNVKDEWLINSNYTSTYAELDFEDTPKVYEEPCEHMPIDIIYEGHKCIPFLLPSREVMFIDEKYLKPFKIETSGVNIFYSRKSKIYGDYLVIKDGLIIKGIIMRNNLVEKEETHFFDNLRTLYEVCSLKYYNSIPEDTKEKEDEPENDD
jgi:hypothetical protein